MGPLLMNPIEGPIIGITFANIYFNLVCQMVSRMKPLYLTGFEFFRWINFFNIGLR